MKITEVFDFEITPVSFRIDWLISRAWSPTCESPISPSSSFFGTKAATESITITSTAFALDEHFGDVHGLFAAARLADQEGLQLDAQLFGPGGVQGVFGVDKGGDAAAALGAGHHVQGQRGLAARFGPEDFDHAAAGDALPAQGDVQRQAAGWNSADGRGRADAQRHDGPFAKLLFDLGQRVFQRRVGVQKRDGAAACSGSGFGRWRVFLAMGVIEVLLFGGMNTLVM